MSKNQTKAPAPAPAPAPKPQPAKADAAANTETAAVSVATNGAPAGDPPPAPVTPAAPAAPVAKAKGKRAAIPDRVMLKVTATQPQRYRAGIAFSRDARCVAVSEDDATVIMADPVLTVSTDLTDEEIAELVKAVAAQDAATEDGSNDN